MPIDDGIAVAADADHRQVVVGDDRAGRDRGHAPVHAVEAVAPAQEVGGRLAAAADAAHLDDLGLVQAQLPRPRS